MEWAGSLARVRRLLVCLNLCFRSAGDNTNPVLCASPLKLDRRGTQILSPDNRDDGARRGHSRAATLSSRPMVAHGTPPRHGPANRVLCPCRADPAGVRAPGGTHFQKKTLDRTKTGFYRTIIRCPERGGGTPKLHLGARAFALVRAWQVCISLVGLQDRSHPETGRCG